MKFLIPNHLTSFILILIFSCSGMTQVPVGHEQIDIIFEAWDKDNSPGMAVGIVKDGELIYAKGYGMANLDHDIPIEPNSVFDIASVSKQFCGMAIAMLISDGKLAEKDDIRIYLPDFPDYGKTITVGNLLHHTSGIRDWPSLLMAAGYQFDDVISFDHIVRIIYQQKELSFETGTEYVYSNSNYSLLVRILEEITGDSFDMWCKENIFEPLDMNDTHFHIDHRRVVRHRVDSYAPAGGTLFMRIANNLCAVGSSSLYTTIEDLAKWIRNFKTGEVGGQEVIEMMTQAYQLENGDPVNYGFGIGMGKWKGRKIWSHTGGWAGFRTIINYLPEEDFGVIVLCNHAGVPPGPLASKVADIYYPDEVGTDEKELVDGTDETRLDDFDPFRENKIKSSVFKEYVGEFELVNSPGFILDFTMEDGKFYVQATGQQRFDLFPSSDTTFFLKVVEAWVSFHPDENGDINKMILHQNGKQEGKRVIETPEEFELGPAELEEYAAEYSCEELSVVYSLMVKDGTLVIDHNRVGQLNLKPVKKDYFQTVGKPGEILFQRNEEGDVCQFRLSAPPRTRNILFVKQN